MHCSKTFEIMLKKENSIGFEYSYDEWPVVRKIIVTLILSTDMAKHFDTVISFRTTYVREK